MTLLKRFAIIAFAVGAMTADCLAQQDNNSSNSGVMRRDVNSRRGSDASGSGVSRRMQDRYGDNESITDADVQWMRVIYRQIDLNKDKNAPLYFPEDPIDGQENMFRIIMRLLCDNEIPAYEYLDGREIFSDKYQVKMSDVFDRFHIINDKAKGWTEKNPKYVVDESDVPANEVLSYYIVERWEFDTRSNRMRTVVEAICPVLHRTGDFGGDAIRYPMFWVKYADLRPHLAHQPIFVSDDNNLPTCTYDDFFTLTMYDGDIYKTRNLRNRSLMQMYDDPDALKRAQDSIQASLTSFESKLWVPDREEIIADSESKKGKGKDAEKEPDLGDVVAAPDVVPVAEGETQEAAEPKPEKKSVRSSSRSGKSNARKSSKPKKEPKQKTLKSSSSGNATRSVRRKR